MERLIKWAAERRWVSAGFKPLVSKGMCIDPGIKPTRQVVAKSNRADIASDEIPELDLPTISVTDEIAEGPVMTLDLDRSSIAKS